jgi:hypothetical protein
MIVIGRYRVYLDVAAQVGVEVFNVPRYEWDRLDDAQRWALNREFLDKAIDANDQIWLATAPEKVPSGSTLEKELKYLADHGWFPRQVDDHWEVAPS